MRRARCISPGGKVRPVKFQKSQCVRPTIGIDRRGRGSDSQGNSLGPQTDEKIDQAGLRHLETIKVSQHDGDAGLKREASTRQRRRDGWLAEPGCKKKTIAQGPQGSLLGLLRRARRRFENQTNRQCQ